MTRPAATMAMMMALLAVPAAAPGEHRYEPPELGPQYVQPVTTTPPPRAPWLEYVDLGCLVAALALASYLSLRLRSRAGVVVLAVASLAYFGFYRKGCVCPIGATQNVAQAIFGRGATIRPDEGKLRHLGLDIGAVENVFRNQYERFVGAEFLEAEGQYWIRLQLNFANRRLVEEIGASPVEAVDAQGRKVEATLADLWRAERSFSIPPVVVGFFVLPLLATLFFGRTFCAAVCPLGAIQDLVVVRPVRVPVWLGEALALLAYAYLGAAVVFAATGSAYVICRYDPFVSFFRLSGSAGMLVVGLCFVAVGMFVGRAYCRFLCPYAVILRVLSRVSKWRVKITPDECIHCKLCEDACPFGAIRKPFEPSARGRRLEGKWRLAVMLAVLPALVAAGGWLGGRLRWSASRVNATVRLAERIDLEEAGAVKGTTDASDAFRHSGRPVEELHEEADLLRGRITTGGAVLGAFLGLVVGLKLVGLSVRRGRVDYEADRAACVACGRCYRYCPREHVRLRRIGGGAAKETR